MTTAGEVAAEKARLAAAEAARSSRLGRRTVGERVAALVDPGSFVEWWGAARSRAPWSGPPEERPPGDGVVVGLGTIEGRAVAVIAHDRRFSRGSIGEAGGRKATRAIARATEIGCPVVMLADSSGARVQEGIAAVTANAEMLEAFALASGKVPLVAVSLGLCGGAAGYGAALCDLDVGVLERSFAFITGPQVIREVIGEDTTLEEIGGAAMHAAKTGLMHAAVEDEATALAWVRRALGYLPSSAAGLPPTGEALEPTEALTDDLIPSSPRKPYDVRRVVERLFDGGSLLELQPDYARNLVVGFARLAGRPVGVLASQPAFMGGALDIAASRKGARFVRLCNAFNLPLVTLVDSPGFFPGVRQEQGGLLLDGAKLISAYAEASGSIPKVALVLRKSVGAASVLSYGADVVLALPTAQVQAMGVEGVMAVALGPGVKGLDGETVAGERRTLAEMHDDPLAGAHEGYVHRMVEAARARDELIAALARSRPARPAAPGGRKLFNIPL